MIATLIVLKALFAAVLLVFATDGAGDVSLLLGKSAVPWTPVTLALLATLAIFMRRKHIRPIAYS